MPFGVPFPNILFSKVPFPTFHFFHIQSGNAEKWKSSKKSSKESSKESSKRTGFESNPLNLGMVKI